MVELALPTHAPAPLICGLCACIHWRLEGDPMRLWEQFFIQRGSLRPGQDVRPYYATYLASHAPHALWQGALGTGATTNQDAGGYTYSAIVTLPYTGYYFVACGAQAGEYTGWFADNSHWPPNFLLLANGAQVGNQSGMVGSGYHNMGTTWLGTHNGGATLYSAGTTFQSRGRWCDGNTHSGYACYVPTPTYP